LQIVDRVLLAILVLFASQWEIAYSTKYHTRVVQLFWIDLIIPAERSRCRLFSKELEHISTRVSCIGSVGFSCGIIGQGIANMIDGIISTRLATENDASRRLKSEFLIQFDGLSSNQDELVIVIGFYCTYVRTNKIIYHFESSESDYL